MARAPDGTATEEKKAVTLESASISASTLEVSFDGTVLGLDGPVSLTLELRNDQAKGLGRGPSGEFAVQGSREPSVVPDEKPRERPEEAPDETPLEMLLEMPEDLLEEIPDGPPAKSPEEPQGGIS